MTIVPYTPIYVYLCLAWISLLLCYCTGHIDLMMLEISRQGVYMEVYYNFADISVMLCSFAFDIADPSIQCSLKYRIRIDGSY